MAKKTVEQKVTEENELKLTAEEYYKWRFQIEVMKNAKLNEKLVDEELKNMELDIKLKQTLAVLMRRTRLEDAKKQVENCMGEYKTTKEKIEERLGISLNNMAIDDFTFEVRSIPNN
jgi:thioester reductase-like protein